MHIMHEIEADRLPLKLAHKNQSEWHGCPCAAGGEKTVSFEQRVNIGEYGLLAADPARVQQEILEFGPVVLGVNAQCMNDDSIATRHGMIDVNIAGPRNHAVTVVGWRHVDNEQHEPTPCWIVRNSWGESKSPSALPDNLNCVATGKNECAAAVQLHEWMGDPHARGYVYIPVDHKPLLVPPSPWMYGRISEESVLARPDVE